MPDAFKSLAKLIATRTKTALASGDLLSIDTEYEIVEEQGIPFIIRSSHNIARKQQAASSKKQSNSDNPFLPYEPAMFVCNLSDTHVCLLNKFNVVDNHVLMVTRRYESQDTLLTLDDFTAISTALQQMDGLVFYNGGRTAGASQQHKHLQLIPRTLVPKMVDLPIERALAIEQLDYNRCHFQCGPYPHWQVRLNCCAQENIETTAHLLLTHYCHICQQLNMYNTEMGLATIPYNLLLTRDWMVFVQRSKEQFEGISFNGLAFAGSFFVRNDKQLSMLKTHGPLAALAFVTVNTSID